MSLCYDFQKWTILTLGLVAISLSVGLVLQVVHAEPHINRTVLANITKNVNCTEFFENLNNTKSNDTEPYNMDIFNRTSVEGYSKILKEKLNGLKIAIACALEKSDKIK